MTHDEFFQRADYDEWHTIDFLHQITGKKITQSGKIVQSNFPLVMFRLEGSMGITRLGYDDVLAVY